MVASVSRARVTSTFSSRLRSRRTCELKVDLVSSRLVAASPSYPSWRFYPSRNPAPDWVAGLVDAFATVQGEIDSRTHNGVSSDQVLAAVRTGLEADGYLVETGKTKGSKITRPVLFGEQGRARVAYDVDGFHPDHGVALEVEAGRGAANNADYRDIIRASLMVDARYLALAMMLDYRGGNQKLKSYEQTRSRVDAIYASDRLRLPLEGLLLIGY